MGERDAEVFSKARAVVIADGFRVTEGLQNGIAQTQNVVNLLVDGGAEPMEVVKQEAKAFLVGLSLARPRLPADYDRLVFSSLLQAADHLGGDGVNVGFELTIATFVRLWGFSRLE